MAATSVNQAEKEEKSIWQPSMQRWVWQSGVEMGNDDSGASIEQQQAQIQEQDDDVENDDSESDEEDEEVDAVMRHALAKYVWHEDLEWDANGSGRLIVVGDVHGMVHELK